MDIQKKATEAASALSSFTVTDFYRSVFAIADDARRRGMVIYGAGYWGHATLEIFKLFGVAPICFCDDDPAKIGTQFHGAEVLSIDDAAKQFPTAVFLVGELNGSVLARNDLGRTTMQRKLRERGLLSEHSGFSPIRYLFLLNGGLDIVKRRRGINMELQLPENLIVFYMTGRSGTIYFESLLDGHPNIYVLPIARTQSATEFEIVYRKRLQFLQDEELVVETAAQLSAYFESDFIPDDIFENRFVYYKGKDGKALRSGMIDAEKLLSCLWELFSGKGRVSFSYFLKAVYTAYGYAIGKIIPQGDAGYIFAHMHTEEGLYFLDGLIDKDCFKRIEYWTIIRNTVPMLNSSFRLIINYEPFLPYAAVNQKNFEAWAASAIGAFNESSERTEGKVMKIFRFEDVKLHIEKYMRSICAYLNIPYSDSMLETTLNGVPTLWEKAGKLIDAKDTSALTTNDYSLHLSSLDIFRINLAAQDYNRAYGYEDDLPDYTEFSEEFLRELFSVPFKFEKPILELAQKCLDAGYIDQLPDVHGAFADVFLDWILVHKEKGRAKLMGEVFTPLEDI